VGDEETEQGIVDKLRLMLAVPIEKIEEDEVHVLVYVAKGQAARAIGSGGSVVRSAELVLDKKLDIKEQGVE
jgi:transcription antitermination factor NusA-like protein